MQHGGELLRGGGRAGGAPVHDGGRVAGHRLTLATIAPATAADVNPFSGAMSLVVEPRLSSATRWYVTADPGEIDGLEFAYLSGNEGPQVESRSGWDVDGVEIRVILDFGAGFIDHRGWFQNLGA